MAKNNFIGDFWSISLEDYWEKNSFNFCFDIIFAKEKSLILCYLKLLAKKLSLRE